MDFGITSYRQLKNRVLVGGSADARRMFNRYARKKTPLTPDIVRRIIRGGILKTFPRKDMQNIENNQLSNIKSNKTAVHLDVGHKPTRQATISVVAVGTVE